MRIRKRVRKAKKLANLVVLMDEAMKYKPYVKWVEKNIDKLTLFDTLDYIQAICYLGDVCKAICQKRGIKLESKEE